MDISQVYYLECSNCYRTYISRNQIDIGDEMVCPSCNDSWTIENVYLNAKKDEPDLELIRFL